MQSLSGHTSAVESVGFDSTEVFVAAGAASGTIKLWDLEEAKSMLMWIVDVILYAYMNILAIVSLGSFPVQLSALLLDIGQTACQLISIPLGNSLPPVHWTLT